MGILWLLLLVLPLIVGFYLLDKKLKAKYQDKFHPHEWGLPVESEPGAVASPVEPRSVVAAPMTNYQVRAAIFSDAERALFNVLLAALQMDYWVFVKVAAVDVLQQKHTAWQGDKRLAAEHFDFVICTKAELRPLAAVTSRPLAMASPLAEACASAKFPVVHIAEQAAYVVQDIRDLLMDKLGDKPGSAAFAATENLRAATARMQEKPEQIEDKTPQDANLDLKLCPKCQSVMLKRTAKTGPQQGKAFWACSTYPKCKGLVPVE